MDIRYDAMDRTRPRPGPRTRSPACPTGSTRTRPNYKREMRAAVRGRDLELRLPRGRHPEQGRLPHQPVVGDMPVIVVRDADGSINCFENRCAHRGALIAFDDGGNVQNNFKCIYHAWSYDLCGNLRGIAFERGINGIRAACRTDFNRDRFSPRKLRTTTLCGLVFATLSADTPPIEDYHRRRGAGPHQARAQPADPGDGPLRAAAAQQLEALRRERQGHLPREPAAPLPRRPSASRA